MEIIKTIAEYIKVTEKEAEIILNKAKVGGEINENMSEKDWFEKRFKPNVVFINEEGYTKMCVDALKILGGTAATDYGSSRQRDLGQLWADMTRGYLGEYAFKLFLKNKLGLDSQLGHEIGTLNEYLPQDVHLIREPGKEFRSPKLTIGIKTSKWNGIWLDIPGNQFNHSDIHVFVKVGTGRDHLFAFFKSISVFKDKVLKKGESVGALNKQESEDIYNALPSFSIIPAYICGFVKKDATYSKLSYSGKKGRKHYTIQTWNGPMLPEDMKDIKQLENISGTVKFEGIGKFAHNNGYLFNTGNLLWKEADWLKIKEKI